MTMRAWQQEAAGDADYKLKEGVAIPKAKPGFIIVKNKTAGSNPIDWKAATPAYAGKTPFPATFGVDGAGIVSEVGEGVTDVKVGDKVFYLTGIDHGYGSYAEYSLVPAQVTFKLPDYWNFKEAGTAGCVLLTSAIALREKLNLQAGETMLINGVSGGTGIVAASIARAMGASKVIGVCSGKNAEFAKKYGCTDVIDYTTENVVERVKAITGGLGADKLYDTVGNNVTALFPAVKFDGVVSAILPLAVDQAAAYAAFGNNLTFSWLLVLSYVAVPWTAAKARKAVEYCLDLIKDKKLEIPITKEFTFDQVQEAQVYNQAGRTVGKAVIIIDPTA